MNPQDKLLKAAAIAEQNGEEDLAFHLTKTARSIRAVRQTEVKLETWDDFSSWWNSNRSPGLIFSLIDALGRGHPAVKKLQHLMKEGEKLDRELHEVYMMLKGSQKERAPEEPKQADTERIAPSAIEYGQDAPEDDVELVEDEEDKTEDTAGCIDLPVFVHPPA